MYNSTLKKDFFKTIRRYHRIAAFGVLGVVVGVLSTAGALSLITGSGYSFGNVYIHDTQVTSVLSTSEPTVLRIPSLNIEANFETPLGVDANQEIEIPDAYDTVAWYKHGPTPGELGPSVILGHVDSYRGPAVLFPLKNVKVGAVIEIDREDGSTALFEVTRLEQYEQEGFPTKEVYGDLDHAGLRLITCSGSFNHGIQRYSHNLIIFARLMDENVEGNEDIE